MRPSELVEILSRIGVDPDMIVRVLQELEKISDPKSDKRPRTLERTRERDRLSRMISQQGGCCWYCGYPIADPYEWEWREKLAGFFLPDGFAVAHEEHMTPRSRGGGNDEENIVAACERCNSQKRNLTVEEYRAFLRCDLFYGECIND